MSFRIAVAGASGFIGQALIKKIKSNPEYILRGLSRSFKEKSISGVEFVEVDLFSMLETEKALENVDAAIYLVHSMSPTAALDQGQFEDYDLIMADNFARAAKKNNLKQIIYLSGIVPRDHELSPHLKSRYEVEETLAYYGTPTTTLRAGLIVGSEGSSATILMRVVNQLAVIPCPDWAETLTQPIDIDNVVESIEFCILNESTYNRFYDLGGASILTYKEMMEQTAQVLNVKRYFPQIYLGSFEVSHKFIAWIIQFVAKAPKNLVQPLVTSLKHTVVVQAPNQLIIPGQKLLTFKEAMQKAYIKGALRKEPTAYKLPKEIAKLNTVRSVQRMILPRGMNADSVSFAYQHWLSHLFGSILKVKKNKNKVSFHLFNMRFPLLNLELSYQRSQPNRQLFYIKGGALVQESTKGRLEFREVLGGRYLIAAIHDFRPKLPWWIYIYSQAPLHLFVMRRFSLWLEKKLTKSVK